VIPDGEWRGFDMAFGGAARVSGVVKQVLRAPLWVGLCLLVERDLGEVVIVVEVLVEVHAELGLNQLVDACRDCFWWVDIEES
jgi:hypothetical protein